MEEYGTVFSQRAQDILEKHVNDSVSVESVRSFLIDMLAPTSDRKDMIYRYEHSIRVAEVARLIAKTEDLPEEDLYVACLLHDVGYRECETWEEHMKQNGLCH